MDRACIWKVSYFGSMLTSTGMVSFTADFYRTYTFHPILYALCYVFTKFERGVARQDAPAFRLPATLLLALLDALIVRVVDAPAEVVHILEAIQDIASYVSHIVDRISSLVTSVHISLLCT